MYSVSPPGDFVPRRIVNCKCNMFALDVKMLDVPSTVGLGIVLVGGGQHAEYTKKLLFLPIMKLDLFISEFKFEYISCIRNVNLK